MPIEVSKEELNPKTGPKLGGNAPNRVPAQDWYPAYPYNQGIREGYLQCISGYQETREEHKREDRTCLVVVVVVSRGLVRRSYGKCMGEGGGCGGRRPDGIWNCAVSCGSAAGRHSGGCGSTGVATRHEKHHFFSFKVRKKTSLIAGKNKNENENENKNRFRFPPEFSIHKGPQ